MKVSIVVPVYNTEEYVRQCLESVISQSHSDFELILVNDGSNDGSQEILDAFVLKDDRVRLVNQVNQGLSAARNMGLRVATGELILFLDSDDELHHLALEELSETMSSQKLDVLFFESQDLVHASRARKKVEGGELESALPGPLHLARDIAHRGWQPSACLQIASRDFVLREGLSFKPGIFHEDNLYSARVLLAGKRISRINFPYYLRREREGSITRISPSLEHVSSLLICLSELRPLVRSRNFRSGTREKIAFDYVLDNILLSAIRKFDRRMGVPFPRQFGSMGSRVSIDVASRFSLHIYAFKGIALRGRNLLRKLVLQNMEYPEPRRDGTSTYAQ